MTHPNPETGTENVSAETPSATTRPVPTTHNPGFFRGK